MKYLHTKLEEVSKKNPKPTLPETNIAPKNDGFQ